MWAESWRRRAPSPGADVRMFATDHPVQVDRHGLHNLISNHRAVEHYAPMLANTPHWDVNPVVRRMLDTLGTAAARDTMDRLVIELRARRSAFFDMLRRLDANGDGRLRQSEVVQGLIALGVRLSEAELASVLGAFDMEGDGTVHHRALYDVIMKQRISLYWLGYPADTEYRQSAVSSLRRLPLCALQHRRLPAGQALCRRGTREHSV